MSSSVSSPILSNASLQTLNKLFTDRGFVLRLSGETALHMVLDEEVIDPIDLTTDATPSQIISILTNCSSVKSFSPLRDDNDFVASARLVNETAIIIDRTPNSDNKPSKRSPTTKSDEKWKRHARKRFFTIGSLYMDFDGKIIDFYGGKEDSEKGIIRFIGKPADEIKDEPFKIFPYLFTYFRYGKQEHLPGVMEAIRKNLPRLQSIPKEELWIVVKTMLVHKNVDKLIPFLMVDLEIGKYLGFNSYKSKDLEEFKTVHQNFLAMELVYHPTTLLASLIRNKCELESISNKLGLHRNCGLIILYILKHRKQDGNLSLRDLQKEIESIPVFFQKLWKIAMVEFLKYKGRKEDLFNFFVSEWAEWSEGSHSMKDIVNSLNNLYFSDL